MARPKVLIVGAGFAGFHCARELERLLLVLCPGPVTRTFGTPGGEQHGRRMKTLAQATHLHDHVLAELELGKAVVDERRRAAHCAFVVAGAGYARVETAAALHRLTRRLLPRFINLRPAVARPLGRHLSGVAAQVVTRGYHLYALPSPRARVRTAADWLMHAALGNDFARLVLPDPISGTLAGQEATGQFLPAGEARQTAERILADNQEGWPA